jgi:predicted ATPase/class 3 adenylate cyclase
MPPLPTGTVTFLFTDIEGSTRLLQQLGNDYAEARGQHQSLLRAAFAAHGGAEVDTQGDAFFVAFATAPQAVAAAAQATRALAEHSWPEDIWPEDTTLRVRMGLHTGTPQLVGDHYVGLDVHRAARVAAAGHGGQVLLSAATRVLAAQALPQGATLRDLGAHRLKDLQEPEQVYQLVLPDLPADFPPLKTLDTFQHNLPLQPTPLLGREEAVADVSTLLRRDEVRLVTLTGPGGVGKTRLGLQVAAELVEEFTDGVWFVRLSRLSDPALVLPTIAQTLGLREAGSQSSEALLREYLRTRHLLLLLDNFEQVAGAAPSMAELLASSPKLQVLVTSRVVLRLQGEQEYPVPPLALSTPRPAESVPVALFVQRAHASRPDFLLSETTAPTIAAICARLDGLPLAIELAAARVKVLPPAQLLQRLERSLPLLVGGARDQEERQQTMHHALSWSYDLLQPSAQRLFRRLGVFVGGSTLEATEVVCGAPKGAPPLGSEVLDGLGTLLDHSLLWQREETDGTARFGMLHVIREYALERLEASGEAEALGRAHLMYFVALAEEVEPRLLRGAQLPEGLARLEREHDNLRAALTWTRQQGEVTLGLRLAGALSRFWLLRGHLREGREWLDGILGLDVAEQSAKRDGLAPGADDVVERVRAKALYGAGELATFRGDFSRAVPLLEESLVLAREASDEALTVQVLNRLGLVTFFQGDRERAAAWYEESLALARQLRDPHLIMLPLLNLGVVAYYRGDLEQAEAATVATVALDRQSGDLLFLSYDLTVLAGIWRQRGDLPQSFSLLHEAFTLLQDAIARGWPMISYAPEQLRGLAEVLAVAGRGEQAARFLGAGEALSEGHGIAWRTLDPKSTEAMLAPARAALGEDTWAAAYAAGQALTLEEAIAEALEATGG